jgi:tetratricopeptide (TPR) repeat protein
MPALREAMRRDSLVFALSGMFFGLIVGWMLGSTQAGGPPRVPPPQAQQTASTPAPAGTGSAPRAGAVDESRVRELRAAADQRPGDPAVRGQLGDLYFDAERFEDAITWYERSLAIDPKDVNVSTDLGVAYYYTNQPDRAIAQFEQSLRVDPNHTKTLLNVGIVRAFGKEDLDGAARAWEQVIEVAPDSPEGRAARQALDSMRSAHPEVGRGR